MAWTRDPTMSVRDNIMEYLVELFRSMRSGIDGYHTTWNVVSRSALTKTDRQVGAALTILEGRDSVSPRIGAQDKTINLVIEFWSRGSPGESVAKTLNRMLLDIQRTMLSDPKLGGLAIKSEELDSELDLDSAETGFVSGASFWTIHYRHNPKDPRKLLGE